jgi:peptide/nickel transport system permease protein
MNAAGRLVSQLVSSGPGKVGVTMLLMLVAVATAVVVIYPSDFGPARWSNPALWADNPKAAPPGWTDVFSRTAQARHQVRQTTAPTTTAPGFQRFELHVSQRAGEPPAFLSVAFSDVVVHEQPPSLVVSLLRPDGAEVSLYRGTLPARDRSRIVLTSEAQAVDGAAAMLRETYGLDVPTMQVSDHLTAILFGQPAADGRIAPLPGDYTVDVTVSTADPDDDVGTVQAVSGGTIYGVMGTDGLGRDLAEGLLFGLPVALLIGIGASLLSTTIGASFGLVSGYVGGWVDTAIQRLADIVVNVPVLPLLIFMVFVFQPQLWLILLVLVVFGWPGLAIMVRSMVLQLRSSPEVESALTLGASRVRIMARHVLPHLAPFMLAQLIFFAPAAILAEAGLSFLGLGDPSLPTWGQILEHGFRAGGVFLGYWWWVIPPGLLIVVTAVTFMLIALGMETVVDPRLRRLRPGRVGRRARS